LERLHFASFRGRAFEVEALVVEVCRFPQIAEVDDLVAIFRLDGGFVLAASRRGRGRRRRAG
jgi:hypothetical protein